MRKTIPALLVLLALVLAGCSAVFAAEPDPNGEIRIVLEDYDIDPDVIRLKAGQKVRLVVVNQGRHLHELMIGRNVRVEDGVTEGFSEDFFAGIADIQVEGPGMIMGLPGMEMEGMDMGDGKMGEGEMGGGEMGDGKMGEGEMPAQKEGMDKEGMDMGKEETAPAQGDHGATEAGHDEGMAGGKFGPIAMDLMGEAHGGLMVMIDPNMIPPDQATILTFTVPPDKVGRWELGCFQEQGQHYDDGMRATLIVEP